VQITALYSHSSRKTNPNFNPNPIIACVPVNYTLAINPNLNPNANRNLIDWMHDAFVAVNAATIASKLTMYQSPISLLTPCSIQEITSD